VLEPAIVASRNETPRRASSSPSSAERAGSPVVVSITSWPTRNSSCTAATTEATASVVNPNYAPLEVLLALPGWDEAAATSVIASREATPLESWNEVQAAAPFAVAAGGIALLTLAQGPVYTLTATCSVPDSAARRSVRALVEITPNLPLYHQILGWWDNWPFAPEPPPASQSFRASGQAGRVNSERESRGRS